MWCHLLINIFFRLGIAGLYCVTKGNIFFRSFVLILEGGLSLLELYFCKGVVNQVDWVALFEEPQFEICYAVFKSICSEELVLRSLSASPFMKPFPTPGA